MHMVMVILTQSLLARVYTPTHVKNVERNGYIKKALAQHKDAHVEMWKTKSLHQDV